MRRERESLWTNGPYIFFVHAAAPISGCQRERKKIDPNAFFDFWGYTTYLHFNIVFDAGAFLMYCR